MLLYTNHTKKSTILLEYHRFPKKQHLASALDAPLHVITRRMNSEKSELIMLDCQRANPGHHPRHPATLRRKSLKAPSRDIPRTGSPYRRRLSRKNDRGCPTSLHSVPYVRRDECFATEVRIILRLFALVTLPVNRKMPLAE